MEEWKRWESAVLDGLDVETFLLCADEQEGRELMLSLMAGMGFQDVDIVFIEHRGPGARVRGRAYVHRPGLSHPFGHPSGSARHLPEAGSP